MKILGNRVLVKREPVVEAGGFEQVKAMDQFISRGVVYKVGVDAINIDEGSVIVFAKFSPDTHTIELEGEEYKAVAVSDIIAVL